MKYITYNIYTMIMNLKNGFHHMIHNFVENILDFCSQNERQPQKAHSNLTNLIQNLKFVGFRTIAVGMLGRRE
jgi:hypothetical protein